MSSEIITERDRKLGEKAYEKVYGRKAHEPVRA